MHWNNNKATKPVNDILTISDEAFIHLCIINYSATWKAQEKNKQDGEGNHTKVPVSSVNCFCSPQIANNIVIDRLQGLPRPLKRQTS
jgi:hypothetical protein